MLHWIEGALNPLTGILYKERVGDADTHTQRGRPCKDGNRDWSHAVTSQEMSRIVGNYQKLGRSKGGLFSRALKRSMALPTPCFQTYLTPAL